MTTYANESHFNHPDAFKEASKGIESPRRRVLSKGTLLFRFGRDPQNATCGNWWLDLQQRDRVNTWAASRGISVPHAVRIMSAVLHSWNAMKYSARASVDRPLLAYEGPSLPQSPKGSGELINPEGLMTPPMKQLFVPGLNDDTLCASCLSYFAIVSVDAGESAILGATPGAAEIHYH